jgi:hypothetical protein
MSALGQKRTFALQNVMPALLLKVDICSALTHVCFGPVADIKLDDGLIWTSVIWIGRDTILKVLSALGQKRTFALRHTTSVSPPIADIGSAK